MSEVFLFSVLLGVISGLLSGLFGLGGGVIIVPALAWLFSYQQVPNELIMIMAVATSLATIIFTSTSSIIAHHKFKSILWNRVFRLSPGIVFGAGIGATIAQAIDADALRWFFVSYLFYVGIRMALPSNAKNKTRKNYPRLDYLAGNGIGFLSSILGIGGGTLTVPYLISRQLAMKNAVAISSACGLPIAISGTVVYAWLGWGKIFLPEWSLGYIYLPAMGGVIVSSVLTAPIGATWANILPAKKLKRFFSVVIFLLAFKMIFI